MYYGVKPVDVSGKPYDPDKECLLTATGDMGESLTVQSQKDEADINIIMERFGVTGHLPSVEMPPLSGDFTGVSNYGDALRLIRAADESFGALDAATRAKFDNNAALFLDWIEDPRRSRDDLVQVGLLAPEPPKVETELPVPATK